MQENSTLPQVSIIVPVYNVEDYIRRCLASIEAQTLKEWECICVDDGSPDACGAILDEWAAKDARFVVIHQENGGVSRARNAGLEAARGEYIGFVDPDDWIESDLYELALETALRTGADVVQWRFVHEEDDGPHPAPEKREGFFDVLQKSGYEYCSWCVHNQLFRRALVLEKGIAFPPGVKNGEDGYFSMIASAFAKKCFFLNRPLYHYEHRRETSVTNNKTLETRMDFIKSRVMACEFIEGAICRKADRQRFSYFLFRKKLEAKSPFIFAIKLRNFRLFRSTFPEVNKRIPLYFLKTRTKRSLVMLLAVWHMEWVAVAIFWVKAKLRGGG